MVGLCSSVCSSDDAHCLQELTSLFEAIDSRAASLGQNCGTSEQRTHLRMVGKSLRFIRQRLFIKGGLGMTDTWVRSWPVGNGV